MWFFLCPPGLLANVVMWGVCTPLAAGICSRPPAPGMVASFLPVLWAFPCVTITPNYRLPRTKPVLSMCTNKTVGIGTCSLVPHGAGAPWPLKAAQVAYQPLLSMHDQGQQVMAIKQLHKPCTSHHCFSSSLSSAFYRRSPVTTVASVLSSASQ